MDRHRGALGIDGATISLRRAEEEAALSEARFNKLTHVLSIKIFAATDEGELAYVNADGKKRALRHVGSGTKGRGSSKRMLSGVLLHGNSRLQQRQNLKKEFASSVLEPAQNRGT